MFVFRWNTLTSYLQLYRHAGLLQLYGNCMVSVAGGFPICVGDLSAYVGFHLPERKALEGAKCPIVLLHKLYPDTSVYAEIPENDQPDNSHLISVTVDGITAYGRGLNKKEAKLNAARAAVEQLRCLGLLQKQIANKKSHIITMKAAAEMSTLEKRPKVVSPAVPEIAVAKLNRLYAPLYFNTVHTSTTEGHTVGLSVNDQYFTGTGRTKKAARLAASENALRAFDMWTKEDEDAKVNSQIDARPKAPEKPESSGFQVPGPECGFGSSHGFHGQPVFRARGVAHGMPLPSRGAMHARGSFSGSHTSGFTPGAFSQPGRGRGRELHARGSGMLSRGTRGRGAAGRGAPVAAPAEMPLPSRGAMHARGSFSGSHTSAFTPGNFSQPGRGRGRELHARGSGMLSRGTRGRGDAGRGAPVAAPAEIPQDKSPVMILNEIYYSAAIYKFGSSVDFENNTHFTTCTVQVDGLTLYGTGCTKKDAKQNAATAAVQQLTAAGILQQRMADKEQFMSQKRSSKNQEKHSAAAQSQDGAVQGSSRMQHGRHPAARGGSTPTGRQGGVGQMQRPRGRGVPSNQTGYPQTSHADFATYKDLW